MIKTILDPVLQIYFDDDDHQYKLDQSFIDFILDNEIELYVILANQDPIKIDLRIKIFDRYTLLFSKFIIFTNEELAMYAMIKFEENITSQEEEFKNENYY